MNNGDQQDDVCGFCGSPAGAVRDAADNVLAYVPFTLVHRGNAIVWACPGCVFMGLGRPGFTFRELLGPDGIITTGRTRGPRLRRDKLDA